MENKVCILNVIKSKIKRTDFLMKMILCMVLFFSTLCQAIDTMNCCYPVSGGEQGNILMYLGYLIMEYSMQMVKIMD